MHTRQDLHALRLNLCVPGICNQNSVGKSIVPGSFGQLLGQASMLNGTFEDAVEVEELLPWDSFDVDFAIGGIDNCGTASLHMNLDQHPELVFRSTSLDDHFFINSLANRLLPLRSQVEMYNAQVQSAKEEKRQRTGVQPRLVGIAIPMLFAYQHVREKHGIAYVQAFVSCVLIFSCNVAAF